MSIRSVLTCVGLSALAGCSTDGSTGPGGGPPPPPPPPDNTVVSVVVQAPKATLEVGEALQLTAQALNSQGGVVAGKTFTFSSGDPDVATVDASSGVVIGVSAGPVSIEAATDGVSGDVDLNVTPPAVASVMIEPTDSQIEEGETRTLAAVTADRNGNELTDRPISWSSTDSTRAAVDPMTGEVIALRPGSTYVKATAESQSDSVELSVSEAQVGSVVVSPDPVFLTVGGEVEVTAVVLSSDAPSSSEAQASQRSTIAGPASRGSAGVSASVTSRTGRALRARIVAWEGSSLASVESRGRRSGRVQSLSAGETEITASVLGFEEPDPQPTGVVGRVVVVMDAPSEQNSSVDPPSRTLAIGETVRLVALWSSFSGEPLLNVPTAWETDPSGIVGIVDTGTDEGLPWADITGVAPGTAEVIAISAAFEEDGTPNEGLQSRISASVTVQ